ncbi:hypothetical protein KC318_g8410 [Hortaea werneckii]|nr:hypothetical protein KC334_g8601 [Hortaea werneckii]KAI6943247.1 hypothetical protein KC355_g15393 [Hortaea werneckii]KAI7663265.1 hypothetical protein KC318_g8410 [Hortaea werneckii]
MARSSSTHLDLLKQQIDQAKLDFGRCVAVAGSPPRDEDYREAVRYSHDNLDFELERLVLMYDGLDYYNLQKVRDAAEARGPGARPTDQEFKQVLVERLTQEDILVHMNDEEWLARSKKWDMQQELQAAVDAMDTVRGEQRRIQALRWPKAKMEEDETSDDEASPPPRKAPKKSGKAPPNSGVAAAGEAKKRNRSKAYRLEHGWTSKPRDAEPQVDDKRAIEILLDTKTAVYQRNNKAPNYFTMKRILYVDKRVILTLKNADGDLVVPEKRAVTALDNSKTSYKNLLNENRTIAVNEKDGLRRRKQSLFKQSHDSSGRFGKTEKTLSSLTTLGRAELVAELRRSI